ncbi:HNH endonuclease [Rhodococcus sovatensis]|uniref:DUF222 domain-containing protein n=1 Tax=Rhodococcus sovatensis TaxID=1805840 RepID=A0ABZ2PQ33_9NOCA
MQKLGDFQSAHTLSDQELVSTLAHIHTTESSLAASKLAILAESDRRGLALKLGYSSVAYWHAKSTRTPEAQSTRQIRLGYWLGQHPTVADALTDATIHHAHATAIADGHTLIHTADPTLDDDALDAHVATLLDVATRSLASTVTTRARELAHTAAADAQARHDAARKAAEAREAARRTREEQARRDAEEKARRTGTPTPTPSPDDTDSTDSAGDPAPELSDGPRPPSAAENPALNVLKIFQLPDGRSRVEGNLDTLTAEKLRTALSPLTAPTPGPGGALDPRTPARRNADGLADILDRHLAGGRGTSFTAPARVTLIVTLADLLTRPCSHHSAGDGNPLDREWPFDMEWTGPISGQLAELLTCDADMTPIIVDGAGVPLAMGRTARLAPPELRQAVIARDRCCVMCGRPAGWCQVHHVQYWIDGGPTDLTNSALVCGRCHRSIHNGDWQLVLGDDGHPQAIPPAAVDPDRQPIPSYHRRRQRTA